MTKKNDIMALDFQYLDCVINIMVLTRQCPELNELAERIQVLVGAIAGFVGLGGFTAIYFAVKHFVLNPVILKIAGHIYKVDMLAAAFVAIGCTIVYIGMVDKAERQCKE